MKNTCLKSRSHSQGTGRFICKLADRYASIMCHYLLTNIELKILKRKESCQDGGHE